MKIKRYIEYLRESYHGFHTIGEWVESLIDDEYIANIVSRFTKEVTQDIDIANSINILKENEKKDIKTQIEDYLSNGIKEKNPEILASAQIENMSESVVMANKGIFTSFLKSLTAMGLKNSKSNLEKCPSDFLIFYHYDNLDSNLIKSIFGRFKSLSNYIDLIDYSKNETSLYFGIKCNGSFEYGFSYEKLSPIGSFKLSLSTIKWLVTLQSPSAEYLKKDIVNLSYSDIILMGKIKMDMILYNPGYHEKKSIPIIQDKIISFGYYGIGKWDNGKLDEDEYMNLKNNFTNFVISKKWGDKVLISIKPSSFWLYIHIKIK